MTEADGYLVDIGATANINPVVNSVESDPNAAALPPSRRVNRSVRHLPLFFRERTQTKPLVHPAR
jgi:hypothetical protein